MVVGGCVKKLWQFWYIMLVEFQNFLVKTFKDSMCYKMNILGLFSLKFEHNTHNDDTARRVRFIQEIYNRLKENINRVTGFYYKQRKLIT